MVGGLGGFSVVVLGTYGIFAPPAFQTSKSTYVVTQVPGVNSDQNMLSRDWGERVTTSRVLRQHRVSCRCDIFLFCWIGGAVGLLFLFRDRVPLKTPVGDGEKKEYKEELI